MGNLGMPELIMIAVLALLLFGPKKLPEIGKQVGRALGEFKRASNDLKRTIEEEMEKSQEPAPTTGPGPGTGPTPRIPEETVAASAPAAPMAAAAPAAPAAPVAATVAPAVHAESVPATAAGGTTTPS